HVATMADSFTSLWTDSSHRDELIQLVDALREQARDQTLPLRANGALVLQSHATYGLYEIIAALGLVSAGGVLRETREGVIRVANEHLDCFFVTLKKGEDDYSPPTRYEDYPISTTLFHWESQSTTSPESATGQR